MTHYRKIYVVEVYLAHDPRPGRRVELKLLPAKYTREAERVLRFKQEARAASSTNHPNIITTSIYDGHQRGKHHRGGQRNHLYNP